MASPHYSTPYSQLSYPSYTPLSVMPAKAADSPRLGSSGGSGNIYYNAPLQYAPQQQQHQHRPPHSSGADLRLLRAAVQHDVALQKRGGAFSAAPTHAEGPHASVGPGWPTPDTASAQRRSAGVSLFSAASTRTNAPLYAPPLQASQHYAHPQPPTSSIRYSDIDRVRSVPTAALPHRPTPAFLSGAATVAGIEVDVQSDVVCAAEAAPYLCAFQEECQSLLALLNAPPRVTPNSAAAAAGAAAEATDDGPESLPPSPYQLAPPPPPPPPPQRSFNESSTTARHATSAEFVRAVGVLRPAPVPPTSGQHTPAPTAASTPTPPPAARVAAAASTPLQTSLSPVADAPPAGEGMDTSAVQPTSTTTYAQLLQEMDELASLLDHQENVSSNHDDTCRSSSNVLQCPPQQSRTTSAATPASSRANDEGAPEEQTHPSPSSVSGQHPHAESSAQPPPQHREAQPRPSSRSRLAPSPAALVSHTPSDFWAAQLLKWVFFLVERKQRVLRRIQSFENPRAPPQRGAVTTAAGATTPATANAAAVCGVEVPPAEDSAAVQVADGLLRLLRSLRPSDGDVDGCASSGQQQRHVCTRAANLLAALTDAEEAVVAGLLNDAAAGATLEREGGAGGGLPATLASTLPPALTASQSPQWPASAAAAALPPEYRRDMLETIALLERLSHENTALKRQVADTHEQLKTLRHEARGERDAKSEIAAHFDRTAAQNTELAARLRDAEARLQAAETAVRPNPQDDALREQLDRQTVNLRDVRRELDDAKADGDTLRRTVLQLRDAVVRHRAVIDLLTRHRRGRQQSGSAMRPSGSRPSDSPPMQLIEDILSGVREAPSTTATSLSGSAMDGDEAEHEDGGAYTVSDEGSSEMYDV